MAECAALIPPYGFALRLRRTHSGYKRAIDALRCAQHILRGGWAGLGAGGRTRSTYGGRWNALRLFHPTVGALRLARLFFRPEARD